MSDYHCHNPFPLLPPEYGHQSPFSSATTDGISWCALQDWRCRDLWGRVWGRWDGLHSVIFRVRVFCCCCFFYEICKLLHEMKILGGQKRFWGTNRGRARLEITDGRNLHGNFVCCHWGPCELSSSSSQEILSKINIHFLLVHYRVESVCWGNSFIQQIFIENLNLPAVF